MSSIVSNHGHSHDHEHGHSHDHDHEHHHHGKKLFFRTKTFRLSIMITLTFSYFVVELAIGNVTNSVALIADSFHMLSDVFALTIALIAVRFGKRRSESNTYGWIRAEVVGANINTVFLLALCLTIIFDAIMRYVNTEAIEQVDLLLITGAVGFGINIIGLLLFQGFHGHSHGGHTHGGHSHGPGKVDPEPSRSMSEHRGREFRRHSARALEEVIGKSVRQAEVNHTDTVIELKEVDKKQKKKASMNMHGVFLHVLADALGSVVVIASALIVKFVPRDVEDTKHWTVYIDPTLSIIIVIIISASAIPFFRDTTAILLQTIPKHLKIQRIQSELLETVPEIESIHELHIWRLTDEKVIVSAHLQRRDLSNYMSVAEKVKKFFHSIGIHSATMQYECKDDRPTPMLTRAHDNSSKVAGDCLLRCDSDTCDNHTCCSLVSARSSMLSKTKTAKNIKVATISHANHHGLGLRTERRTAYVPKQLERATRAPTVPPRPVRVARPNRPTGDVIIRPFHSGRFGTIDSSEA